MRKSDEVLFQSVFKHSDTVYWQNVGDEIVILDPDQGEYFGIQETAVKIWTLLADPISIDEICSNLIAEYNVDEETCKTQVVKFVEELHNRELIISV